MKVKFIKITNNTIFFNVKTIIELKDMTVNGFSAGIYAITKKTSPIADISSLSSISPLIPLFFTVAVFAPLIGIMLRGNIRMGAIGMIAVAIIYTPLMYALGINMIVAGFTSTLLVVIALIILALNPR